MKIKLQAGGVISYTPFIPNSGTTTSSSKTSETKKDKITGTLQKEIIDILKQNGIPSDVNAFMDKANSYLSQSQSLSNMSIFGGTDDDYSMQQLMAIQSMANEVKFNHEVYKEAANNLGSENAWSDYAVNDRGQLYVINDKSELKQVTISDYKDNSDKYQALTYSQLMGLRERDLAMDKTVLNDAKNAVGMQTIAKHVKDIATAFGENSNQFYVSKDKESIKAGIEALLGNGPEGYYKIGYKHKVSQDDIDNAVSFLYSNLDSSMKYKLRAEAAVHGQDPTKYLIGYLNAAINEYNTVSQTSDFDKSASDFDPDGDKKGNSGNYTEDTLAEKYSSGSGLPPAKYDILMTSKSGVPMYVYSQNAGPIRTNDNKKNYGNANLQDVLVNGYGMSDVDQRSITFGDIPVDWSDASKIVYDGSTNIKRVYLPAINDNGRIRPNLELYNEISKLNENIINQGWNEGQIKTFIASRPDLIYDENTKMIVSKNSQLFLTFGGIASDDTFGNNLNDSNWLIPQSDEIDRNWKDEYNFLTGYETKDKNARELNRKKTNWLFGYKFYKGNIFVPITDPMLASSIYNNQFWNKSDYVNMTNKAESVMKNNIRNSNSELITNFN